MSSNAYAAAQKGHISRKVGPSDPSTLRAQARNKSVTPATENIPQKRSSSRLSVSGRSSSSRKTAAQTSETLTVPNSYFTSRDEKITCLSLKFNLDPSKNAHRRVVCEGCMKVYDVAPNNILTDEIRNAERVAAKKKCKRPWDPIWLKHSDKGKKQRCHDFRALFDTEPCESVMTELDDDDNNNLVPTRVPKRQKRASANSEQQDDAPQERNEQQDDILNEQQEDALQETASQPKIYKMFDDDGHFTAEAFEDIEKQLKTTYKERPPNDNDKRVVGMLMKWIFAHSGNDDDVRRAELLSFPKNKPMTVARVPTMYENVETNARLTRSRTKKCSEWLDTLLKGSFNTDNTWLELLMQKRKTIIPKKYLIKEWNANHRFDTETTLAMLKYSNINPSQLERLAQFIDVETREPGNNRGVRLFAPTKECFRRKKEYVKHKFPSLKFKKVELAAVVAAKKKGKQEVTKLVNTAVGSTRVVEIIMENMESNRKNGRFRSSEKRYNVPVPWEGETALYKIGADGGAGSNKHTANPVNVDNPQGQEHVYPFLEFSGAKDSYNNLKRVYEEHPEMKRDVEDLMRRKMSYIEVTIRKQVGSCIAINTDAGHDYKNPKPLPDLAKDIVVVASASSSSQPYPKSQPLEKYAVHIDFSKVKSTKLIRNQSQNCYEGLMFQDEDGKHVGTSLFKTPVMCTSSDHDRHDCKMNQVLLMGVLASDLQLLCTLFGHQGASAMWFCLFCLLKQSQSKDEFEGKAHETIQRTLESITEDAQQFKAAFDGASQQEKNKSTFKSNLTQTCSHSITDTPLLDIPLDCITYATMHVVLGLTKWLVDLTIAGYAHIEKKAALTDEGKKQVAFREPIELALNKARRYKDYLTEQLKDAKAAVASQHTVASRIAELAGELEEVRQLIDEDFSYTDDSELGQRQAQILAELEQLGGQVQSEMQSANNSGEGDDIDYLQMLLEQVCITKETIDELEEYLSNHGSHSARVVDAVLKRNGVDQATYFKGAIIGNHCMTFAEKGDQIYAGILEELEPAIENQELKRELRAFTDRMKAIVAVWYEIQRVIKSTEKQSTQKINQFEENTNKLRKLIWDICKADVPISGWKPKLTRSMKAHLLFGGHLLRQLREWGTLGGIDEQNVESSHAIWNKLLRQFGATRGKELQRRVLCDYLFQTADFVHSDIARVKKETKRNLKSSSDGTATPRAASLRSDDDGIIAEDFLSESGNNVALGLLATKINAEVALHQELFLTEEDPDNTTGSEAQREKISKDDTIIHICPDPNCKKLRLKLAFDIHHYESHKIITNIGDRNAEGVA